MLRAQEQLGDLLGQRFAGGRAPDTFRKEREVWGGGNAWKVTVTDGLPRRKACRSRSSCKVRLRENCRRL